ncbi:MAG: LysR family transcriptional regulator [Lachnospiraceae bacterium]|nr:LysR family transcriptional regulator [Lachnospiraceae bacterium]
MNHNQKVMTMNKRVYHKYVLEINEYGNLTKAAAALGISQPALSSGLTNLENELGFKIFNRKNVPIKLTPEGEIYYEYIKRLQILSDDFKERLDSYREKSNCRVAVGGPVAYVESMVVDAVARISEEHPDYEITIKCSPLAELMEMASKGEINCFICTSDEIADSFAKELIEHERVYLCIPSDNPVNDSLKAFQIAPGQEGTLFDFSVLNGEEFIFMEEGQPLYKQMNRFFEEYGIVPNSKVSVNQVSTAVNLSIRGKGICFASEESLRGNYDLSGVCVYALPDTISGRSIYVAYDKELFLPVACRDFIDCLIQVHKEK